MSLYNSVLRHSVLHEGVHYYTVLPYILVTFRHLWVSWSSRLWRLPRKLKAHILREQGKMKKEDYIFNNKSVYGVLWKLCSLSLQNSIRGTERFSGIIRRKYRIPVGRSQENMLNVPWQSIILYRHDHQKIWRLIKYIYIYLSWDLPSVSSTIFYQTTFPLQYRQPRLISSTMCLTISPMTG